MAELVPSNPPLLDTYDAAGPGMGGVAFIPTEIGTTVPILWRKPFLKSIQAHHISYTYHKGTIINSDLKLCGNITHYDAVAQFANTLKKDYRYLLRQYCKCIFVTKKDLPPPQDLLPIYYLLWSQAHHHGFYRYISLRDYILGQADIMADICSCTWHLIDLQLFVYFDLNFPQKE